MGISRRRTLRSAVVVVVIVAVFGGGWAAARRFQSPAQREANARPPSPGPLFVPIERGVLTDQVSGSGTMTYERVQDVGATAGGVVTGQPSKVGTVVRAGAVITEVESRPVFLLPGRFDFYRDLTPGSSGADVVQLQAGLRSAGYSVPDRENGAYGTATAAAVKRLYSASGYAAPRGAPRADLGVARQLPATLDKVPAVGSRIEDGGAVASVAYGRLVARVTLDGATFDRVRAGQRADVMVDGDQSSLAGRVGALDAGSSKSDPQVSITFGSVPPRSLVGRPAVATITREAVSRRGLIVPTRAVADDADGTQRITVKVGSSRHAVAVHVLGSLNGRSVVEAVGTSGGSALQPGEMVQVG